jgi:hypothetical protein
MMPKPAPLGAHCARAAFVWEGVRQDATDGWAEPGDQLVTFFRSGS